MKRNEIRTLALLTGVFACAAAASAAGWDDIEFWVGSGANRAALVLDWNDGKSTESLLWGYRWDGVATGLDMLEAAVAADPRLFAHVSEAGPFGVSIYGLGYDLDGDGVFGVSPGLAFDANGRSVGEPDDARQATDPEDHWAEGWNSGFWGYNLKDSEAAPWVSAAFGPVDRVLSDGVWDGFSFAPDFIFTDPSDPTPAVVPEPASWALLIGGALFAVGWPRRRP